ncbi:sulfatase [Ruminococcaceae bacterium OttesenSCG-928-L11]|nr:sulfatase [Ruminococcaceae bacterium OttesenSCG-928-L11]
MNIVYLHTHDSGRYLEPYGYGISTPNLMALAKESTLFRHCYCAGPTCSPSRAALLTGTWPHVNGMLGLTHRGFGLRDYDMHLARYLTGFGYETVLSGIQHEAADGNDIGYTRILQDTWGGDMKNDHAAERDRTSAELAAGYLTEKAKQGGRFFLSVGLLNTHRPFPEETDPVRADYAMPPHTMYDCAATRRDMAGYCKSAAIADECFGIVLDAIRTAGLADDTIVMFTTDHGIAFPHMKCNLYDTGTGVALMIRYPGNPTAGTATDALVSQIDIFPTLCELCDVPIPEWVDGTSVVQVLSGRDQTGSDAVFSEVTYHGSYEPARSIRTERYKLIRRFDFHLGVVPCNIDNGPSKRFLLDSGLMKQTVAREILIDLHLDPMERENRVGDSGYLDIYNDLSARLSAWMEQTGDPLVQVTHRVPLPDGARINRLESIHAENPEYE